jgi:hypothetical protein
MYWDNKVDVEIARPFLHQPKYFKLGEVFLAWLSLVDR